MPNVDWVGLALLAQAVILALIAFAVLFVALRVREVAKGSGVALRALEGGLANANAEIEAQRNAVAERIEQSELRNAGHFAELANERKAAAQGHAELHVALSAGQSTHEEHLTRLDDGLAGLWGHGHLGLTGAHIPALAASEERTDGTIVMRCEVPGCPAKLTLRLPPKG